MEPTEHLTSKTLLRQAQDFVGKSRCSVGHSVSEVQDRAKARSCIYCEHQLALYESLGLAIAAVEPADAPGRCAKCDRWLEARCAVCGPVEPNESPAVDALVAALLEINNGPPSFLQDDEVASWAGEIAGEALRAHRASVTKECSHGHNPRSCVECNPDEQPFEKEATPVEHDGPTRNPKVLLAGETECAQRCRCEGSCSRMARCTTRVLNATLGGESFASTL